MKKPDSDSLRTFCDAVISHRVTKAGILSGDDSSLLVINNISLVAPKTCETTTTSASTITTPAQITKPTTEAEGISAKQEMPSATRDSLQLLKLRLLKLLEANQPIISIITFPENIIS